MAAIADGESGGEAEAHARRVVSFVNAAHALDHFVLLIYPTAVIALAPEMHLDYAALIPLSTGALTMFGVLALPAGFLANRVGRRNMLAVFFMGIAVACAGMATAHTTAGLAAWLFVLGSFAAIYHPVGSATLVTHTAPGRLGHALGLNGVFGNLGVASAPLATAALASAFGWRAAFVVPAIAAAILGAFFIALVPQEREASAESSKGPRHTFPAGRLILLSAAFAVSIVCGGATFNILMTILPKLIDEQLGAALPLWLVGSMATVALLLGAVTQINVGRLIGCTPLPRLLAVISVLQPAGFALASISTGVMLLFGLVFIIVAIFGNVVVLDAIVARYIPDEYRSRAYGLRYFLGFAASGLLVPPAVGRLYDSGGFPLVLGAAAVLGALLSLAAFAIWRLMRGGTPPPSSAMSCPIV